MEYLELNPKEIERNKYNRKFLFTFDKVEKNIENVLHTIIVIEKEYYFVDYLLIKENQCLIRASKILHMDDVENFKKLEWNLSDVNYGKNGIFYSFFKNHESKEHGFTLYYTPSIPKIYIQDNYDFGGSKFLEFPFK